MMKQLYSNKKRANIILLVGAITIFSVIFLLTQSSKGPLGHEHNNYNYPGGSDRSREPKQVYFDLGANRGDSIETFVALDGKTVGLNNNQKLSGRGATGKWDIWAFEVNPQWNEELDRVEKKIMSERPNQYNLFIKKQSAAYINDDHVTVYLDTVQHGSVGTSLMSNHRTVVNSRSKNGENTVQAKAYDMARVIKENYSLDDLIIVKMDVEGAEYEILPHLLLSGVAPYIDYLYVEYHGQRVVPENRQLLQAEHGLNLVFQKAGVKVYGNWN